MDTLTMERAFVVATKATAMGLVAVPLLILVRPSNLLWLFVLHLSGLVAFGLAVAIRLRRFSDADWFDNSGSWRQRWFTAAAVVALVTGSVALLTLASSAALGFEPSLQFLQLLSALDIAWATAALYYGLRWRKGPRTATTFSVILGVLCVYSIWNYLNRFGFTEEGGWLLDKPGLLRYVIPGDVVAAFVALGAVTWGSRPRLQESEPLPNQPR